MTEPKGAPKDLAKLSDEALMTEWEKHSQAALDAKANARACSREVSRRRAEAADPDQQAAAQVIQAKGQENG